MDASAKCAALENRRRERGGCYAGPGSLPSELSFSSGWTSVGKAGYTGPALGSGGGVGGAGVGGGGGGGLVGGRGIRCDFYGFGVGNGFVWHFGAEPFEA